jgi:hypothetical protein
MTCYKDQVYILNPAYAMRNDSHQVVMYSKWNFPAACKHEK